MNATRAFFSGAHAISDATGANLKFSYALQIAITLFFYVRLRRTFSSRMARAYLAIITGSLLLLASAYLFK